MRWKCRPASRNGCSTRWAMKAQHRPASNNVTANNPRLSCCARSRRRSDSCMICCPRSVKAATSCWRSACNRPMALPASVLTLKYCSSERCRVASRCPSTALAYSAKVACSSLATACSAGSRVFSTNSSTSFWLLSFSSTDIAMRLFALSSWPPSCSMKPEDTLALERIAISRALFSRSDWCAVRSSSVICSSLPSAARQALTVENNKVRLNNNSTQNIPVRIFRSANMRAVLLLCWLTPLRVEVSTVGQQLSESPPQA